MTIQVGTVELVAFLAAAVLIHLFRRRRPPAPGDLDEVASSPLEQLPDLPEDEGRRRTGRHAGFRCAAKP